MKRNKLVSVCLIAIAAGFVIAGAGFLFGGRVYGLSLGRRGVIVNSNQNIKSMNYIEEEKELESFRNLDVELGFADFEIQKSDHFGIKYRLQEDRLVTSTSDGDTLVLKQKDSGFNVTLFSMGSAGMDSDGNEYVVIYVPEEALGTISISNDAGNISIDTITAENLLVNDSFGNLEIGTADVEKCDFDLDSGDINIENLNGNTCTIQTSFGSTKIEKAVLKGRLECDADSGDLTIGSLSADSVDAASKFGSIELGLKETVDAYAIDADTDFGTIEVNGTEMGSTCQTSSAAGSERRLILSADSGDISLRDAK